MKKWLRVVALLLVAVMMFTMVVSCNKKKPETPNPTPNNPSTPNNPETPSDPSEPSDPSDPTDPDDPVNPDIPLTKAQILAAIKAAGVSTINAKVKAKFTGSVKSSVLGVEDYKIPDFEKELDNITIADVDVSDVVKALLIELAFNSDDDAEFKTTSDLLKALFSALGTFGGNLETDFGGVEGYIAERIVSAVFPEIIASLATDVIYPEKDFVVYIDSKDEKFDENHKAFSVEWLGENTERQNSGAYVWNSELKVFEYAAYDEESGKYMVAGTAVPEGTEIYSKYTYTGIIFDAKAADELVEDLKTPLSNIVKKVFKGADLSEIAADVNTICELIGAKDANKFMTVLKNELADLEADFSDDGNYVVEVALPALYAALKAVPEISDYDVALWNRLFGALLDDNSPAAAGDWLGAYTLIYCEAIVYEFVSTYVPLFKDYNGETYNNVMLYEKDGKFYKADGTEYVLENGMYFAAERISMGYAYFDDENVAQFAGSTLEVAEKVKPEGKDLYARVICTILGYDPDEYAKTFNDLHDKFASVVEKAVFDGTVSFYDLFGAEIVAEMLRPEDDYDFDHTGCTLFILMLKADTAETLKLISGVIESVYADEGDIVDIAKIMKSISEAMEEAEKAFEEAEDGDYFTDVVLKVVSDVLGDEENAALLDEKVFGKGVSAKIKAIADDYIENGEFCTSKFLDFVNTVIGNNDKDLGKLTTALTAAIYAAKEDLGEDGDYFTDVILTAISNVLKVTEGETNENAAYIDTVLGEGAAADIKTLVDMLISGNINKTDLIAICNKLIAVLEPSSDEDSTIEAASEGEVEGVENADDTAAIKALLANIVKSIKAAAEASEEDTVSVETIKAAIIDGIFGADAAKEISDFIKYYNKNGGIEKAQLIKLCDYLLAMVDDLYREQNPIKAYINYVKEYATNLTPADGEDKVTVTADDLIIVSLKYYYEANEIAGDKTANYIAALAEAIKDGDSEEIANAYLYVIFSVGKQYVDNFADSDETANKTIDMVALGEFFMALVDYINADEDSLEDAETALIEKIEAADLAYANYMKNMFFDAGVVALVNAGTVTRLAHIVIDLRTLDISEFMEKYGTDRVASVVSAIIAYAYVKSDESKFNFEVADVSVVYVDILLRIMLTEEEFNEVIGKLLDALKIEDINEELYPVYVEGDLTIIQRETFIARKIALKAAVKAYLEAYFPTTDDDEDDNIETVDDTDDDVVESIDDLLYILKIGNAIAPEYFGEYLTAYTAADDASHEKFYAKVEADAINALAGLVSANTGYAKGVCDMVITIFASPEKIVDLAPEALIKAKSGEYGEVETYVLYVISAIGHLAMDDVTNVVWADVFGFIALPEEFAEADYAALANNIRSKSNILDEIESIITGSVVPTMTDDSTVITFHVDLYYSFDVITFDFDFDLEVAM